MEVREVEEGRELDRQGRPGRKRRVIEENEKAT
jgi:hypothetical protein